MDNVATNGNSLSSRRVVTLNFDEKPNVFVINLGDKAFGLTLEEMRELFEEYKKHDLLAY